MGGRGTNLNVNAYLSRSDKDQMSEFTGLGLYGNIKFLKPNSKNAQTPIFSHTPGRVYVIIDKNNKIRDIGIYDNNHINKTVIHLSDTKQGIHEHKSIKHVGHDELSPSHKNLVEQVNRLYNLHKGEWKNG